MIATIISDRSGFDLIPRSAEFFVPDAILVNAYEAALLDNPGYQRQNINDEKSGRKRKISDILPHIKRHEHYHKKYEGQHSYDRRFLKVSGGRSVGAYELAKVFERFRHYFRIYAARVGSIIALTSETLLAGKPLSSACCCIRSAFGAV